MSDASPVMMKAASSIERKRARVSTIPAKVVNMPTVVQPGSRVGVAALSGPVDRDDFAAGSAALQAMGYELSLATNVLGCCGYLAGTDEERLEGFHELLGSDVDAIIFARGGHGLLRIFDRIDWNLLGQRPRWFVGYSDLVPLLLEISRRTGWMTLHGPMVATDLSRPLDQAERASLVNALKGQLDSSWPLVPIGLGGASVDSGAAGTLGENAVSGPIYGGCLAMICASLGTFAQPSLRDAIVFLEDVGEAPYRIDRALAQLGLAGLDEAAGVVFGYCQEARESDAKPDGTTAGIDDGLFEVLAHYSARLKVPFWCGLPMGHGIPNHALPLGALAAIASDTLTISSSME